MFTRQINTYVLSLILVCTAILMVPAQGYSKVNKKLLVSAGCKTGYFVVKRLADAYEAETGKRIVLGSTGNKKAMAMMAEEKVDFTFTCKHVSKLEKKLNLDTTFAASLESLPLAKDPIIIVANTGGQVANLSLQQLTDIFTGKINNWNEVDGPDLPIVTAHIRPGMESGILRLFKEFTVGVKGELDPAAKKIADPAGLGRYVFDTPGGITFMPLVGYKESYGEILQVDGVSPSKENVLNGSYGLSASYFLTVEKESSSQTQEFINFALSDIGRAITGGKYVPVAK